MRELMVFLHRWVALILSVFIIVISVTGSLIVLREPADRALHRDFFESPVPAAGAARLPLDSLMASARSRGAVATLTLPDRDGLAAIAAMANRDEVSVNPWSGAVQGRRTQADRKAGLVNGLFAVNGTLHTSLLGGAVGVQVVEWSTIASVFLLLGGIYLWWKDKIWRMQWRASWKRINYDLHHVLGIVTFVVLVPMTVTGVTMHYRVVGRALERIGRRAEAPAKAQSAPGPGAAAVSLEAAARAGLAALPGAALRTVSVPGDAARPISLGLRFPEDRSDNGRSRIYVDRWTGAVLYVHSARNDGIGTRMNNLQRPLHTGDVYGLPTQIIWFVTSLILAFQVVTGALMWWHARPARKAEARRKREKTTKPAKPAEAAV